MQGSVIKRMYAGFALIIVLFAFTITIMLRSTSQIHSNFETVSNTSLPLVTISNQTSVDLLSADKSFKDFLTTQSSSRMDELLALFGEQRKRFQQTINQLTKAAQAYPSLSDEIKQLKAIEEGYFTEAQEAMNNYQAMFAAQSQVQQSVRSFQKQHSDLTLGMKAAVDNQDKIAVKVMANSYFAKLKDAEVATSDALASTDIEFVLKAIATNRKAATHLNYAFRGLATQMPSLNDDFKAPVEQFTLDIGQRGGVLDQHANYLTARNALYDNISSLTQTVDTAMEILAGFQDAATISLNASLAEAGEVYQEGVIKAIGIGVIVTLFAAAIGYHISHAVRSPLTHILRTLEALTEGDMTQRIDIRYNNEFSRVSSHINSLADNLHNIIEQLNDAAKNLTQTATANENTSSKTQSQLSQQREQTASVATAMTEMAHSVQEVAQSAQSSLELVHRVEVASQSGRDVMSSNISTIHQLESRLNESVDAVAELQRMSGQIGSILDVISNIAEQTNLLALNAAIEAARAGEQGRGFAVVADEVRVLASKTTQSTTEIETMISNLQSSSRSASKVIESCMSEMDLSVEQASKANQAMEEIQALIIEISQMSTHISQAAGEQSETSTVIAQNIEEINHIADQSYHAMEDITHASQNLTVLASKQSILVDRFKI
ncbi:methyl-accepting chemotaxis protein [Vibrio sp. SM6]|uniref:Methyl-accepting chemotaxis protein n=1 Tax=Vibrio agarilyticus TaxID=2726741 RepID=A0A7X8TQS9_9VIBR|nr:methyl-accepting chemotaxis protein [Vibrio agarilyticus]NLS13054.1 methyl-accepting chemotaxis protein [Vibrio agarilyticus]